VKLITRQASCDSKQRLGFPDSAPQIHDGDGAQR
jgi:hypothetical protein